MIKYHINHISYVPYIPYITYIKFFKRKNSITLPLFLFIVTFFCLTISSISINTVNAATVDKTKPLELEADQAQYQDQQQQAYFQGNVIVKKGSMLLKAHQLDLEQLPGGYQHFIASSLPGQMIYFEENTDVPHESIQAIAKKIDLNNQTQIIQLSGNVTFSRLYKKKKIETFQTPSLNIDLITGVIIAQNSQLQQNDSKDTSKRVKVTIMPK